MLSDSNHKGCMIKPSTHLYKDYVIPKVDKKSNKGCTNKVPDYSREHSEILAEVKNSYLDVTYNLSSHWDYEGLELIDNHQYRTQFSNKRQQLRNHIRKDIAEQFAFCFVESDIIRYVCRQGKPNQPDLYLLLGDQKQGVNLCRHADVCLQWATLRLKSHIKVLVYKIFPGIVHHIELRKSVSAPYLEPTPNHDSHSSKQPARLEQSLYDKIQNSNIFLYEYDDEDCLPKKMPSNCLPYAIISLRKKGTLPSIPRLQSETKKKSKRQTLRVPQETFGKNNELGESTNVVDDDHISNHEQSQSAEKNAVLRDDVEKGLSKDQNSNIIMEKRCEKETGKSSKSRWQRTELKSSSYERRVIHEKLLESFLDPNYVLSSDWKYNGMELIENTVLRKKFRRKKKLSRKRWNMLKRRQHFVLQHQKS
ncbi:protein TASOR-like [Saccoglossus kowalevskii]|uniref:Protein FAM208A-like n=1 Tax=Saccoglossus kowalevskii TaxID=10224 RepID=A0ABM0MZE1_SACKO|nr:PREDICTED: protein FAM208A-like [Saccoglossus kowalevskii]